MDQEELIQLHTVDNSAETADLRTLLADHDIEVVLHYQDSDVAIMVSEDQFDDARDILDRQKELDNEIEHEIFEFNEYDDTDDDKWQLEENFSPFDPEDSFIELGRDLVENIDDEQYPQE